jgi:hypothetical protein
MAIYFGTIPLTTVEKPLKIPFSGRGAGTYHPIGLSFRDILFHFYQVKSYKVSVQGIRFFDPFFKFMENQGGLPSTIIGAVQGVAAVSDMFGRPDYSLNGVTKIVDENFKEILFTDAGIAPCGRRHYLQQGLSSLLIDYTDILIKDNLYWPKIKLFIGDNSSLSTALNATPEVTDVTQMFSTNLVSFDRGNMIEVWTGDLSTFVFGSIEPSVSLSRTAISLSNAQQTSTIGIDAGEGESWDSQSDSSWISILSGRSGMGSGILTFRVAANSTGSKRTGIISINGAKVSITQDLTISLRPSSFLIGSVAKYLSSTILTSGPDFEWKVDDHGANWLWVVSPLQGVGNSQVNIQVTYNSSGYARSSTISVNEETITIYQDA